MNSAPICFVHIPKCAGGTLIAVLRQAFTPAAIANAGNYFRNAESAAIAAEKIRRAASRKAIHAGHVPYNVYRANVPEGARYITLLRDPVSRVISHFYRHTRHQGYAGIAEALNDMPELSNLGTRMLCDDPNGAMDEAALASAQRNLDSFAFVGLQERFDESVVLLHRVLGLPDLVAYGDSIHVNNDRPTASAISVAEREMIREANALDIALYDYAAAIFARAVAAAGPSLPADLARYRDLRGEAKEADAAMWERALEWVAQRPDAAKTPFEELAAEARVDDIRPRTLKAAVREIRSGEKQAKRAERMKDQHAAEEHAAEEHAAEEHAAEEHAAEEHAAEVDGDFAREDMDLYRESLGQRGSAAH